MIAITADRQVISDSFSAQTSVQEGLWKQLGESAKELYSSSDAKPCTCNVGCAARTVPLPAYAPELVSAVPLHEVKSFLKHEWGLKRKHGQKGALFSLEPLKATINGPRATTSAGKKHDLAPVAGSMGLGTLLVVCPVPGSDASRVQEKNELLLPAQAGWVFTVGTSVHIQDAEDNYRVVLHYAVVSTAKAVWYKRWCPAPVKKALRDASKSKAKADVKAR
jgi:hypothetical protein